MLIENQRRLLFPCIAIDRSTNSKQGSTFSAAVSRLLCAVFDVDSVSDGGWLLGFGFYVTD